MNQADILAIKVAVTNLAKAQSDLQAIQKRAENIQKSNEAANRRGMRQFGDLIRTNRSHASSVDNVSRSYMALAATFGTVVGAGAAVYKSIQSFEKLQAFRTGLGAMVGSGSATTIERDARALASQTGTRMTEFMPNIQGLVGTESTSASEIIPLLRSFLALGKKNGALPDQINRAFTQFTQVAAQGKLQGDELRVMQENMVNLRSLLMKAGLGDRIGSQTAPITFEEIKKAMLEFGKTEDAAKYLRIGNDFATAAMNRLSDTVMLDVLPVLGKMLTPAAIRLANWLESLAKKATPAVIEKYSKKFIEFTNYLITFAIKNGPALINTLAWLTDVTGTLLESFTSLNELVGGKLFQALVAIAAIKVVGGVVGGAATSAASSAAGSAIGGAIGVAGLAIWSAFIGLLGAGVLKLAIFLETVGGIGVAVAGWLATLGTAVGAASAGMVASVVAAGAAIGFAIGWLINQIPGVQNIQKNIGNWWNDNVMGGNSVKANMDTVAPGWEPGGRLYNDWKAKQDAKKGITSGVSARRSDPQRMITEGGANGLRYARP
jgi:tape measure domain-containing protein